MTVLSETRPCARREYRCGLCCEPIRAGERHYAQSNVCDGRVDTVRSHLGCSELAQLMCGPAKDNAYEDGCLVTVFAERARGAQLVPSAEDAAYTTTARVLLSVIYAAARTRGAEEVTP